MVTWVVITTTCGANSDEFSGCRLDDLLFAMLLLTEYLHPFYCDIYITEMCMKILYIVLLCLETSLSSHLFLFSPKEASTISQIYRHNIHTRFTVISALMKCIREPFLQFYYPISPFQTENKGSPVGRLCRRRGHRWLSWRQLAVPPVASGVVDFAVYGFLWFSVLD